MSPPNQPPEPITCYHVPRRFNLRAVIVLTTLLAMACALLKLVNTPAELYVVVFVLAGTAALGQILFPRTPRTASALATAILFGGATFGGILVDWLTSQNSPMSLWFLMICFPIGNSLVGAGLGYISGTLIAGVFMIADLISPNSMFPKPTPQPGALPPASSDSPTS